MRTAEVLQDVEIHSRVTLAELPRERLEAMADAGAEVLEVYRALGKTGDNIVGELLRNNGTFFEWDHYPPGDVYDAEHHAQFYYHAHPSDQRFQNEHGHFHTFLRPKGMPKAVKPAAVPGFKMPEDPNDALSHLIAISMDKAGFPFRLFTTNRWVTGEVWYTAKDVSRLIDYFVVDHTQPSWPVNRWVTGMLRLFQPQIVELLKKRDETIAMWRDAHPGRDIFEDREYEIASYMDVDVEGQIREVGKALLERG